MYLVEQVSFKWILAFKSVLYLLYFMFQTCFKHYAGIIINKTYLLLHFITRIVTKTFKFCAQHPNTILMNFV